MSSPLRYFSVSISPVPFGLVVNELDDTEIYLAVPGAHADALRGARALGVLLGRSDVEPLHLNLASPESSWAGIADPPRTAIGFRYSADLHRRLGLLRQALIDLPYHHPRLRQLILAL